MNITSYYIIVWRHAKVVAFKITFHTQNHKCGGIKAKNPGDVVEYLSYLSSSSEVSIMWPGLVLDGRNLVFKLSMIKKKLFFIHKPDLCTFIKFKLMHWLLDLS